jgi:hypothetical protein
MGNAHARLLLSLAYEGGAEGEREPLDVAMIVSVHTAYMDAIERVLGAPPNCLHRADIEAVKVWVAALHGAGRE